MNKNYTEFLKSRVQEGVNMDQVINSIKDINNITIQELVLLSNATNRTFTELIGAYVEDYPYVGNNTMLKTYVESKNINAIKRLILDHKIMLYKNNVWFAHCSNILSNYPVKPELYQLTLKLLIENNEIEMALRISNKECHLNHFDPNMPNIDKYLFLNNYPSRFFNIVYIDLDDVIKARLEDRIVKEYLKQIEEFKACKYELRIFTPLIENHFDLTSDGNTNCRYSLNNIYKNFSLDNQQLILNSWEVCFN